MRPGPALFDRALEISGARAVVLLDADARVLWSAGASASDASVVAVSVALLARTAAGLVALADPADEFGDLLVTSSGAFQVLRLLGDGSDRVAYLTLGRAGVNLAMARHEFKLLVDEYVRSSAAGAPVAGPAEPGQRDDAGTALPALPRRRPNSHPVPATGRPVAGNVAPSWLAMVGRPYVTDDSVLDRILVKLRLL